MDNRPTQSRAARGDRAKRNAVPLYPGLMLGEARTLLEAGDHLSDDDSDEAKFGLAPVLIYALGLEIALKCVLALDKGAETMGALHKLIRREESHDLAAIFLKLDARHQKAIGAKFWKLMPEFGVVIAMPGHDGIATFETANNGTFLGLLEELHDAFEASRYVYESPSGASAQLTVARCALSAAIEYGDSLSELT